MLELHVNFCNIFCISNQEKVTGPERFRLISPSPMFSLALFGWRPVGPVKKTRKDPQGLLETHWSLCGLVEVLQSLVVLFSRSEIQKCL